MVGPRSSTWIRHRSCAGFHSVLGSGLITIADDCGEMDGGEEVCGEFSDAAEVLEAAKHALDGVPAAIQHAAEGRFEAAVQFWRNVGRSAALGDRVSHGVRIVTTIGDYQGTARQPMDQRRGCATVCGLAASQHEEARTALLVAQGVEFGGASAAADADRLRPFPPFPPAAQRWAFIVELSSRRSAGGPPASAST